MENAKLLFPLDEKQLSYEYDAQGYMLKYRGRPIGGAASTAARRPGQRKGPDEKLHAETARNEIAKLASGIGQPRFLAKMQAIEAERQLANIPPADATNIDVTAHHDPAGKMYFPSKPYGLQVWFPDSPASNGGHNGSDSAKTKTEIEQKARQQAADYTARKYKFVLVTFHRRNGKILSRLASE